MNITNAKPNFVNPNVMRKFGKATEVVRRKKSYLKFSFVMTVKPSQSTAVFNPHSGVASSLFPRRLPNRIFYSLTPNPQLEVWGPLQSPARSAVGRALAGMVDPMGPGCERGQGPVWGHDNQGKGQMHVEDESHSPHSSGRDRA